MGSSDFQDTKHKQDYKNRPDIAIVGVGTLFPESSNATLFWKNILDKKDLISDVPPSHWLLEDYYDPDPTTPDKTYGKRGGFLRDTPFDPIEWGIPPNIIPATDTTQLLALIVAKMCLKNAAQVDFSHMDRSKMSVILGVTSAQELYGHMVARLQKPVWQKVLRENGIHEQDVQKICEGISNEYQPWQENTFPGLLGNVVAGRIANRLDFGGTNCITDAACASSFSAISMAVNELYLGDSDLVLAGGADTMNDILMHMCFSKTPALSKSGDCRPFSDKADGTLLGEGIAMFALKRLEDAERDGDFIYALLKSVGSSSDGRSKSIYAPLSDGQSKAILRAYERAGFGAETVELVEAHGTGTKAGDAAEFGGLTIAYSQGESNRNSLSTTYDKQWCALGSVKSQIGHSKATAGAAGLFKAVMSLHQGVLPPTIKVDRPNPALDIEQTPFYINTETRPWIRSTEYPRRAGVSSFGFGGSNFHIALEEYIPKTDQNGKKAKRLRSASHELFLFSSQNSEELLQKLQQNISKIQEQQTFLWLSQESLSEFSVSHPCRASLICSDATDAEKKIQQLIEHLQKTPQEGLTTPNGINYTCEAANIDGKIALLFPGQGSQYVGMSRGVSCTWEESRTAWDDSLTYLNSNRLDSDDELRQNPLHRVVFPVPVFDAEQRQQQQNMLTETQWAQPAIGTCSLAMYRLLEKMGLKGDMTGGHSYGEITALHVAGVIDTKTFFEISRQRGELMKKAAATTAGAMSAVKKDPSKLQDMLENWNRELHTDVVVANHNSPVQAVVSGSTEDIAKIEQKCSEEGITAQRLGVATAFHSKIVAGAVPEFEDFLHNCSFQQPSIPVFSNTTGTIYPSSVESFPSHLAHQIASPVRFVDEIENMYSDGARIFVEIGPKNTLSKLVKRILRKKNIHMFHTDIVGKDGIWGFLSCLADMAIAGLDISYEKLWADFECSDLSQWDIEKKHHKKASPLSIPLNGSNYQKPYPPKGGAEALPKPNWTVEKKSESKDFRKQPNHQKAVSTTEKATLSVEDLPPKNHQQSISPANLPLGTTTQNNTQVHSRSTKNMSQSQKPPASHQVSSGWLAAFQMAQQQTAQAHIAYQQAMSQAHIAYLQAAQGAFAGLTGVQPATSLGLPQQASPIQQQFVPATYAQSVSPQISSEVASTFSSSPSIETSRYSEYSNAMSEPVGQGVANFSQAGSTNTMNVDRMNVEKMNVDTMRSNTTSPNNEQSGVDVRGLLLEVVSEKTGYPADSLGMEMTLEGDLGIDSIKRVEILSTMQERAPSLPEVDGASMATLQTLGEIVGFMIPSSEKNTLEEAENSVNFTKAELSIIDNSATTAPCSIVQLRCAPTTDIQHPLQTKIISEGIFVLGDGYFGQSLRNKLREKGIVVLESWDADLLEQNCFVVDVRPLELVWNVEDNPQIVEQALSMSRDVFLKTQRMSASTEKMLVVVQSNHGFGLGHFLDGSESRTKKISAITSGVAGIVRCAQVEWPHSLCKNIDVDESISKEDIVDLLVEEIVDASPQLDVAFVSHKDEIQRYTLDQCPMDVEDRKTQFSPSSSDVFLVSGGARGVTAECMIELARAVPAKFILIGRSPLEKDPFPDVADDKLIANLLSSKMVATPKEARAMSKKILSSREIHQNIQKIRSLGAGVKYISVDVMDTKTLAMELDTIRQEWGVGKNITGVIHGAGVLADKEISQKKISDFDWVFDVKIKGMLSLLDVTKEDPLKYFIFFSSVAARFGNRGQCDYAAANEVLNKMAQYEFCRRKSENRPLSVIRSIGWGPWEGGMVTPSLQKHFESMGVSLISLQDGARAFVDLMMSSHQQIEWIVGKGEGLSVQKELPHWQVQLDDQKHAYLLDHQIQGNVVIPMAQVASWIKQGIQVWHGEVFVDDSQIIIEDMTVLRGLSFDATDLFGRHICLVGQKLSSNSYDIGVCNSALTSSTSIDEIGKAGKLGYRCRVTISDIDVEPLTHTAFSKTYWKESTKKSISSKEAIYQSPVLFHGRDFQMMDYVAFSRIDECLGQFTTRSEMISVDACLQLALLWAEQRLNKSTVPMRIGSLYVRRPQDIVSCVLLGQESNGLKTRSEGYFLDSDDKVCGVIKDIETIVFR